MNRSPNLPPPSWLVRSNNSLSTWKILHPDDNTAVEDLVRELEATDVWRRIYRHLSTPRPGLVGAILGWGFALWSGGPFSWLDIVGAPWAAEKCDEMQAKYGDRFACPPLLREMAEKGETFYERFAPEAKAA